MPILRVLVDVLTEPGAVRKVVGSAEDAHVPSAGVDVGVQVCFLRCPAFFNPCCVVAYGLCVKYSIICLFVPLRCNIRHRPKTVEAELPGQCESHL